MESRSFLTSHARVLLCIARDPGMRLRDLSASLGITERSAHAIVADLTTAGFLVKHKHGRRNRYQIQAHLPLPEPATREPAIGDVLAMLAGDGAGQEPPGSGPGQQHVGISDSDHEQLRRSIDEPTEGPWGSQVERVEIKDISLPETMKRSMSRRAEAERERRSRIITADSEYQAAKRLAAAANAMAPDPGSSTSSRPPRPAVA